MFLLCMRGSLFALPMRKDQSLSALAILSNVRCCILPLRIVRCNRRTDESLSLALTHVGQLGRSCHSLGIHVHHPEHLECSDAKAYNMTSAASVWRHITSLVHAPSKAARPAWSGAAGWLRNNGQLGLWRWTFVAGWFTCTTVI